MQYIANILEKISVFKSVEQGKLEQLIKKFIDQTETFLLLYRAAPYYLIDDHIYHECLKKNDHREKKKGNNVMDSMHARSALSYCDYFITEDDKLEKFCQKIIKDLKLKVKVMSLDEFKNLADSNICINKLVRV